MGAITGENDSSLHHLVQLRILDDQCAVLILAKTKILARRCYVQDVPHRINSASASAEQLRVSLVLKLVFLPKDGAKRQLSSLARPQWGPAVRFGSAAGPVAAAAAS